MTGEFLARGAFLKKKADGESLCIEDGVACALAYRLLPAAQRQCKAKRARGIALAACAVGVKLRRGGANAREKEVAAAEMA